MKKRWYVSCWQIAHRWSFSTNRRRATHLEHVSVWPQMPKAVHSNGSAQTAQQSSMAIGGYSERGGVDLLAAQEGFRQFFLYAAISSHTAAGMPRKSTGTWDQSQTGPMGLCSNLMQLRLPDVLRTASEKQESTGQENTAEKAREKSLEKSLLPVTVRHIFIPPRADGPNLSLTSEE